MPVGEKFGPKFVKVKDKSGNEWLCPMEGIKNVKEATQEELKNCIEFDLFTHNIGLLDVER